MARNGLELTWIASQRLWRKRYKGKTYTFPCGKHKTKAESYPAALVKWKAIKQTVDDNQQVHTDVKALLTELKALRASLTHAKAIDGPAVDTMIKGLQAQSSDIQQSVRNLSAKTGNPIRTESKTLAGLLDEYTLYQSENVSKSRYQVVQSVMKTVKRIIGTSNIPESEEAIARILNQIRDSLRLRIDNNTLAPKTYNSYLTDVRAFFNWAYTNYKLPALPRNMNQLLKHLPVQTNAKKIELDTIHVLFNAANDRMKCFIALALNCGYYQNDIATLDSSMIHNGYIIRTRHKTGIPSKHKLWPVTQNLLEKTANPNGLCFLNTNNNPLISFSGRSRNDSIKNAFFRLCNKTGVTGVSFSHFRDTSATLIEQHDRTLSSQFLSHADSRTAKHYIDIANMDTSQLDKAIDWLDSQYQLGGESNNQAYGTADAT